MTPSKLFYKKKGKRYFKKRVKDWVEQGKNEDLILKLQNADPTELVDSNDLSLLHIATMFGNVDMIQFLVHKGCDIDARNSYGKTALMIAITSKYSDAVRLLLNANANLFLTDKNRQYPLQLFFRQMTFDGNILKLVFEKMKKILIDTQELVDKFIESDCQLFHIIYLEDEEITKIFLDKKTIIEHTEKAILRAIERFDVENTKVLLNYGERYMERRITLLHAFYRLLFKWTESEDYREIVDSLTCIICHWDILDSKNVYLFELLTEKLNGKALHHILDSDIKQYVKNNFGSDLQLHVLGNENPEVVRWIQSQEINFHATSRRKLTGLHIAMKNCVVENVKYLLKKGVDPNSIDEYGQTALFYIFHNQDHLDRNEKCSKLLLLYGADPLIRCNDGYSIIECVEQTTDNLKNFSTIFQSFICHFAMLEAHNMPINLSINNCLNAFRNLSAFQGCYKQCEKLKKHQFCGKLTLFDILIRNSEEISRQVSDNHYLKISEVTNTQEYNEYYVSTLTKRVRKAILIKKLRLEAINLIGDSIPKFKSTYPVLQKIVGYLNDELFCMFKDSLPRLKRELMDQ